MEYIVRSFCNFYSLYKNACHTLLQLFLKAYANTHTRTEDKNQSLHTAVPLPYHCLLALRCSSKKQKIVTVRVNSAGVMKKKSCIYYSSSVHWLTIIHMDSKYLWPCFMRVRKQNKTHWNTTMQNPGKHLRGSFSLKLATETPSDIHLSTSMAALQEILVKNVTQQLM